MHERERETHTHRHTDTDTYLLLHLTLHLDHVANQGRIDFAVCVKVQFVVPAMMTEVFQQPLFEPAHHPLGARWREKLKTQLGFVLLFSFPCLPPSDQHRRKRSESMRVSMK